jgi:hypothetical protein
MMVAFKKTAAETIDTLERAVLMQQLSDTLEAISKGADQIAGREYWQAYRTITTAELILSEIAYKLHELDLKDGGGT